MKIIFEKNILIKFGDSDPQGILYFARTYDYAHECLEEFWAQSKLGWTYWFQNPEFAVPLRHSACEYLAPMRVGEKYRATLSITKVGESSIEFSCEFSNPAISKVCAKVTTVHVFVDRKDFAKIKVPEQMRAVLWH